MSRKLAAEAVPLVIQEILEDEIDRILRNIYETNTKLYDDPTDPQPPSDNGG